MFGQSLVRVTRLVRNSRYFRGHAALRDVKPVTTPTNAAPNQTKTPDSEQVLGAKMHRCSNFDKWMLVWIKKYPNKDQVPEKITLDVLHNAQSKARIRTANLMILFTVMGCIWAVVTGKRDAKSGKSMSQQNKDWHDKINKDYKASIAEPKTS